MKEDLVINPEKLIVSGRCSLCHTQIDDRRKRNFQEYYIYFTDYTWLRTAVCSDCLMKMPKYENQEKVLIKHKNTSYQTWGDKKIKK